MRRVWTPTSTQGTYALTTFSIRGFVRSCILFFAVFTISLPLLPVLAWNLHEFLPRVLSNLFFFWPQIVMFPYGLTPYGDPTRLVLDRTAAVTAAIVWWLLVGGAFAWLTHYRSTRFALMAVVPFIVCAAILCQLLLALLGCSPYVEGP